MIKTLLTASTLCISTSLLAQGNTGIVPPYLLEAIEKYKAEQAAKEKGFVCEDSEGKYSFDAKAKTLTVGDRVMDLDCQEVEQPTHPDESGLLYSCTEARAGDGRFSINVHLIGMLGITMGEVSLGQMFPLPPYELASFRCQN